MAARTWSDVTPPELSAWSKVTQARGLPVRRRDRLRGCRPAPARRFRAVHLSHARRRLSLEESRRRHFAGSMGQHDSGRPGPPRGCSMPARKRGIEVSFDAGDRGSRSSKISRRVGARHRRAWQRPGHRHARPRILDHGRCLGAAAVRCRNRDRSVLAVQTRDAAYRVRLPEFTGTPMPKDEPMAANPPLGAYLDYTLKTTSNSPVTLDDYRIRQERWFGVRSQRRPGRRPSNSTKSSISAGMGGCPQHLVPLPRVRTASSGRCIIRRHRIAARSPIPGRAALLAPPGDYRVDADREWGRAATTAASCWPIHA